MAGLVIQATGRTEFEDGLRLGSPGGVLSDNPSVRTSSLVTPVVTHVWLCVRCGKIPSVSGGNLVQLEVPASSSSGISFPVPLGGPSSKPCPAQYSLQLVESVGMLWCKENI